MDTPEKQYQQCTEVLSEEELTRLAKQYVHPHGNRRGLNLGWLTTTWLVACATRGYAKNHIVLFTTPISEQSCTALVTSVCVAQHIHQKQTTDIL